jgi:uncharacterized protein (DUF305 family)
MWRRYTRHVLFGALAVALAMAALGSALAQGRPEGPPDWAGAHRPAAEQMGPGRGLMQGPGPHWGPGMGPGQRWGPARDPARRYIEEMIPHHEDALVMAELALTQAEHPELRALATEILRVQAEEIGLMGEWYRAWYGTAVPADQAHGRHGMMMGMRPGHDASALDGARPFDKAFIEAMIPHHRMAVHMSAMALSRAEQPELRALLQAIIVGQSDEIALMRGWYEAWYGTAVPYQPGWRAR